MTTMKRMICECHFDNGATIMVEWRIDRYYLYVDGVCYEEGFSRWKDVVNSVKVKYNLDLEKHLVMQERTASKRWHEPDKMLVG
jgi:transposase-like protein